MRNKKSKTKKEGGAPNGSPGRAKRTYRRTTPIGRALNHVTKAKSVSHYVLSRLANWEHSANLNLTQAISKIRLALANLQSAEIDLGRLKESDWQPPRKQTNVAYEIGDDVEIAEKHQGKYLHVYKIEVIKDLRVTKVLPTGEIAVEHSHGKDTAKFIVPKTHLCRRGSSKILV